MQASLTRSVVVSATGVPNDTKLPTTVGENRASHASRHPKSVSVQTGVQYNTTTTAATRRSSHRKLGRRGSATKTKGIADRSPHASHHAAQQSQYSSTQSQSLSHQQRVSNHWRPHDSKQFQRSLPTIVYIPGTELNPPSLQSEHDAATALRTFLVSSAPSNRRKRSRLLVTPPPETCVLPPPPPPSCTPCSSARTPPSSPSMATSAPSMLCVLAATGHPKFSRQSVRYSTWLHLSDRNR